MNAVEPPRTESLDVVMVCSGNICRSPMAEVIARDAFDAAGLGTQVRLRSCGIGAWHLGEGMDPRAAAELRRAGYPSEHVATQFNASHRLATLLVAMDGGHVSALVARGVYPVRVRLLRSFDSTSPAGAEIEDPYYGPAEGFARTRIQIEAAVPGLLIWVNQTLLDSSQR